VADRVPAGIYDSPMASERVYGDPSAWDHAVAHVDMDAFYVSVELLSRPELRGKPVIVGPIDPAARGVVMTASYEARKFGVHSALPIVVARRRCPQAVVIPRNMASYREASVQLMEVLRGFSDLVEVVGMDEAYVDLGDSPAPKTRARQIKREVLERTGLTCSIGLGPNRLIAKIASDLDKPDGLCVLPRERFLEVVGSRPARIIPGVGPRTEERLVALDVKTVADLARAPESGLSAVLGPNHARSLGRRACGFGGTEVAVERKRKSESRERTFASDQVDPTTMREELARMARAVANHLGEQGIRGRTVTLKIRLAPFRTYTRSRTLPGPTADPVEVTVAALALFDAFERDAPVRLLGVGVSNLTDEEDNESGTTPSDANTSPEAGPMQLALD
jgi:DNA polymerase-4